MDLNDVFGPNPKRPSSPEFWKLSEIILAYDAGTQPGFASDEEAEAFYAKTLTEAGIDAESLIYAAAQRALRAMRSIDAPLDTQRLMILFTSLWQEGFLVGERYGRERT